MIRIAIVDDEEEYRLQEKAFIEEYAKQSGEQFDIKSFDNGVDFISDYKPVYDIVFLDIEMPHMDGMTTARKLRGMDVRVCIVFITKMSKYAVEGYEVNAIDFVVKPIKFFNYVDKLKRAISYVRAHKEEEIVIRSDKKYFRLALSQIYYIVKDRNYLIYVTACGRFRERGTIESVKKNLYKNGFSVCNSGCIVNLRQVERVISTSIFINGDELPLSRYRMKDFNQDMLNLLRQD